MIYFNVIKVISLKKAFGGENYVQKSKRVQNKTEKNEKKE